MSAQKVAFDSDVHSVCINEDFVLVGLKDGSVSCICTKYKRNQWTNKFSNNVPITATLIQTNENNQNWFFAGNNDGQLVVFDEEGKALVLKQCRKDTIFALLNLGNDHIVVYHPGGNDEYAIRSSDEEEHTLQKVHSCNNSGNYSINSDLEQNENILKGRDKGSHPIDRYNCMMSARTTGILGVQFSRHQSVIFAYAFTSDDHNYFDNVQNGGSKLKLPILDKNGKIVKHLDFKAMVRNIVNNTWNIGKGNAGDEIYFLLETGDVLRSKGKELEEVGEADTDFTETMMEKVFVSRKGKKVTSFDVYDDKICFVLNQRVLEISSTDDLLTDRLTDGPKVKFVDDDLLAVGQEVNIVEYDRLAVAPKINIIEDDSLAVGPEINIVEDDPLAVGQEINIVEDDLLAVGPEINIVEE